MNTEEITESLEDDLKNMPWVFKHWKADDSIELRNTGEFLDEEGIDDTVDKVLEDLGEGDFRSVFEGKMGIMKKDGDYWKTTVDREGGAGEEKKRIERDEAEELIRESLTRGDSSFVTPNNLELKISDIKDIYLESSGDDSYLNIKLEGRKALTLRSDGGVQVRSW